MAGRGRGGRGGGRGGGSEGFNLLRETADDLGIDSRTIGFENDPPPLYPEMALPSPVMLTEEDRYRVQKQRELVFRLRNSPYHIVQANSINDIERYTDHRRKGAGRGRGRGSSSSSSLYQSLTSAPTEAGETYLPAELIGNKLVAGGRQGGTAAAAAAAAAAIPHLARSGKALSALEDREQKSQAGGGAGGTPGKAAGAAGDEQGSDVDQEEQPENIVEDEDDYGINHYDSAEERMSDDGGGGDGGDAIF